MTPDELGALSYQLLDAHEQVSRLSSRRPHKAAKVLCTELRALTERQDLWNELAETSEKLADYRSQGDDILSNLRTLIRAEGQVLARLGRDHVEIGNTLASVYDALDLAKARDTDTSRAGIRNLQDRMVRTTDLICQASRGPILHAADFVLSRKGARVLGAAGLGAANAWFAVTADGGAVSSASIRAAVAVADGNLGEIADLLE